MQYHFIIIRGHHVLENCLHFNMLCMMQNSPPKNSASYKLHPIALDGTLSYLHLKVLLILYNNELYVYNNEHFDEVSLQLKP